MLTTFIIILLHIANCISVVTDKSTILAGAKGYPPLQGIKNLPHPPEYRVGCYRPFFPNHHFCWAIHDLLAPHRKTRLLQGVFAAGIIACTDAKRWIMHLDWGIRNYFSSGSQVIWHQPDHVILWNCKKKKNSLGHGRIILKCRDLHAWYAKCSDLSFTASRRLQLAVEHSCVTGFVLRNKPRNLNANACLTRWKISSLPSSIEDGMPGLGFPNWNIELIKVRNGKPGSWQLGWEAGKFRNHPGLVKIIGNVESSHQKKVG